MSRCVHIPGAIVMVGDPVIKLGRYYFEMHQYCGPIRLRKDGEVSKQDFGAYFWPLFEKWQEQQK